MVATAVPPAVETLVAPPQPPCPNCGSAMVSEFCARCGEQQPAHRDLTLRGMVYDAAQDLFGVDGRVPRTLWALITKPGLLTREFIDGRRGRYAKPLSLFLVLNVLFFLIQPYTGLVRYNLRDYTSGDGDVHIHRTELVRERAAGAGQSDSVYATRFDATLGNQKKGMLLFAVPVLALLMPLIFFRSTPKRYFVQHVVFAVHAYAFMLVMLTVGIVLIIYAIAGWARLFALAGLKSGAFETFMFGEPGVILVVGASLMTYAWLAIRKAYGGSTWAAAIRATVIAAVQLMLIPLFRDLLFYTTLYST